MQSVIYWYTTLTHSRYYWYQYHLKMWLFFSLLSDVPLLVSLIIYLLLFPSMSHTSQFYVDVLISPWPDQQATTATKQGIYSTHSTRSSIHFLARCYNFCKPLKRKIQKVVRPTRSPRQQWPPRRTQNGDLSIVFFQSREQVVVRRGQIRRIGWEIKVIQYFLLYLTLLEAISFYLHIHLDKFTAWKSLYFHGATSPSVPGPSNYRNLTITLRHSPQSVGFLWASDQPDAETSTWQHTTFTRRRLHCSRRDSRTRNPNKISAAHPCFRRPGHWDRILSLQT